MYFTPASVLSALALLPAALAVTLPSQDSFYVAPGNLKSYKPGAIIRSRPVPGPLSGNLAYKSAYQFLYRTTDNSGNPDSTVGTIIVPSTNANSAKLLSYQFAEDSAYINCAPSYAIQFGASADAAFLPAIELGAVNQALQQGWYVVTPDYEGNNATFLANTGAGQRTLDGIRAALQSGSFSGVSSSASTVMWGYSGGSLASGFAAELQKSYAPELKIAGVALGGTVPSIIDVLYAVNKSLFAGLIPSGIAGLTQAYPALAAYVAQNIIPSKAAAFNQAKSQCLSADILTYAFQDVYTYTTKPATVFTAPLPSKIISANNPGQHIPTMPIYIYKGTADEISPLNDTVAYVQKYCNGGASVDFVEYEGQDHLELILTGVSGAITWLTARLNGIPQFGCSTSTVS